MRRESPPASPSPGPPQIIFEDANLIVISKPAGLLSQGDHTGRPSLVDWAQAHFGRPYVGLIHRLDTNTSGIMLIAKRTKAAERLTRALQSDQIHRSYLALISGSLTAPARWEHMLIKNETTNLVRAFSPDHPEAARKSAKLSALQVSPLAPGPLGTTWVRFTLETGRSHQIRAQAQAMGHALVGDPKYGTRSSAQSTSTLSAQDLGRELGLSRPALHSWTLEFQHPIGATGEAKESRPFLQFCAELPDDLAKLPGARACSAALGKQSGL